MLIVDVLRRALYGANRHGYLQPEDVRAAEQVLQRLQKAATDIDELGVRCGTTSCLGARAGTVTLGLLAESPRPGNQCDGCAAGYPVRKNLNGFGGSTHFVPYPSGSISCTKDRYPAQLPEGKPACGCHCRGGCGGTYETCLYPCSEHLPF